MGKDKKEKAFVHKIDGAVETTGKAVGGVGGGLTGAASGAVIGNYFLIQSCKNSVNKKV